MQPTTNHNLPSDEACRNDFPANLLSRVVKADALVTVEELTTEGDIKFSAPLREVGLTRQALSRIRSCRSAFFVNLLGELLVRKNLALFAKMLEQIDVKDYDRIVNCYQHRHFGMTVETDDVIHFQFHISLVQAILVEDIEGMFGQAV